MVNLVLEKALDFRRSIDAIAVLIDEAEFCISEKGLELKATDPSQISMVDFSLEKKFFKKYDVSSSVKIGIDLVQLKDIMARATAKDSLELSLEDEGTRLSATFIGGSKRSFSIPLIDISTSELPQPKIEFDAEVKMKASVIQEGLKDASLISNHVILGVTASSFTISAKSSKGNLHNETDKKDKDMVELKAKSECAAMYPLDYLQDMLKAADSKTDVRLSLKGDAPVEISYAIGPANVTYFLAPRIEN